MSDSDEKLEQIQKLTEKLSATMNGVDMDICALSLLACVKLIYDTADESIHEPIVLTMINLIQDMGSKLENTEVIVGHIESDSEEGHTGMEPESNTRH